MKTFTIIISNVIDNRQMVQRIEAWDTQQAEFIALHIAVTHHSFSEVGTTAQVITI